MSTSTASNIGAGTTITGGAITAGAQTVEQAGIVAWTNAYSVQIGITIGICGILIQLASFLINQYRISKSTKQ